MNTEQREQRQVEALNAAGYKGATLSEVASSLLTEVGETQDALAALLARLRTGMKLVDGDGNALTLYPTDYLQITASDGSRWLIATVTADGDLMLHTPPLEYRWPDSSPHHPDPHPDRAFTDL